MHPFLFRIGAYPVVPTYGIMAGFAVVVCVWMLKRFVPREGLEPPRTIKGILIVAMISLFGAKMMEILVSWRRMVDDPKQILLTLALSGGVMLGGVITGIVSGYFWCQREKIPFLVGLDLLALVGALSMAVARWGCFFSGCCFGKATDLPWGITYPEIGHQLHADLPYGVVHPTPIYFSLFSLGLFLILAWRYRHKRFHGQIAYTYLVLYGIGRFFLEFLRGDDERGFLFGGLLSTSQFLSILLVISASTLGMVLHHRHRTSGAPDWKPAAAPLRPPGTERKGQRKTRPAVRVRGKKGAVQGVK